MTTLLGVPQISQTLLQDLDRVGRRYAHWTPEAYFELNGAYLVEYSRGNLEILPMPTMTHQRIASRLYDALRAAAPRDGEVLFAGTRVKVGLDTYREPDVLYIPPEWKSSTQDDFVERVGLVIEVVSESSRNHDLETKREEYASAGIPEYWIVDPQQSLITVLTLQGLEYAIQGEYGRGQISSSIFLRGFAISVDEAFKS
ncbi:MAG TPA: Uma2 family endonuclease [Humisphaera sp.]|nr:Uma2 family endonuclease [Humisphaera sp.]